jgi:endoglucanase
MMMQVRFSMLRVVLVGALLAALVAAAPAGAPAAPVARTAQGADPNAPNPLLSIQRWFVDTDWHPAWRTYRRWRHRRPNDAREILKIAREPQARWFGKWDRNPYRKITQYLEKTQELQPGSVPLVTIFRHPHPTSADPNRFGKNRHAGHKYSFGPRAYRSYDKWIRWFARGIGRRRVVIAFEPDAFGSFVYLTKADRGRRFRSFRRAIDVLSKLPNATVYIEGGASDWRHASETARLLNYVGISKVRGFMLNVTHFDTTNRSIAHGMKISRRTGGKPFVVSTHANGRGAKHYRVRFGGRRIRVTVWCNPSNSALGIPPTANTGRPKVDGYLWIGRAGYSAGRCGGGTTAGTWWANRGLLMAKRARWASGALAYPFKG